MDDNRRRVLVWGLSIMVGLASGSNYVYSAYAPQLATELHISSTTVNLIGLAGNLGMYITGPVWGKIVDTRGQRIPLLIGGLSCFFGYSTIRLFLNHTISIRGSNATPHSSPSSLRLAILLFAMFLTGSAGSAGLSSAINATAKSFPDARRASATGAVLAGFGLSAFFFSTLSRTLFAGEAAGLVGLLAFGTGLPMVIGSIWIRPVPPVEDQGYRHVGDTEHTTIPSVIFDSESRNSEDFRPRRSLSSREDRPSLEMVRSRSPDKTRAMSRNNSSGPLLRSTSALSLPVKTEYSPRDLIGTPSFYLLAVVLALLCGTGLMYINNVGTIALVLARQGRAAYNKKEVSGWQSRNVGVISIWNCLGRIGAGIASDTWKTRYHGERIWLLPIVAGLFILSQTVALFTTHVESLWIVSTLLGFAYGCLFNVLPMLVLEWFGMAHFSQNFGWIAVSPVIGGNLFNLVFGRVYDSNSVGHGDTSDEEESEVKRAILSLGRRMLINRSNEGAHDCVLGVPCYASAFKVSLFACTIALGISIGLGRSRMKDLRQSRVVPERQDELGELEDEI